MVLAQALLLLAALRPAALALGGPLPLHALPAALRAAPLPAQVAAAAAVTELPVPERPQPEEFVTTDAGHSVDEFVKDRVKQVTVGNKTQACFDRLGCFPTDDPWWSLLRPLPAPDHPSKVGTAFYLFTRRQPARRRIPLEPSVELGGLDVDGARPTVFITHGFLSDTNASWMLDMKDALLHKVDANVILTDWGPGASGALKYMTAAANTRVVAAEAARLIRQMVKDCKVKPENIHLIGHSLGAQISGYIGKAVKNIGKITALDPAQPAFEGYNPKVRLHASDATFVEVVHTDGKPTIPLFGLGMIAPHGDVDYYINGGASQPGCLIPKSLPSLTSLTDFLNLPLSVIENIVSCPHGRSTEVFIEAIRLSNCTFWGHPGTVVDTALSVVSNGVLLRYLTPSKEECSAQTCSPLQLRNERLPARGSFVVATTGARPFCISEPEVDGRMAKALGAVRDVGRDAIGALAGLPGAFGRPRP